MNPWWQNKSLQIENDQLMLDGIPLHYLAQQHSTPLYVYSMSIAEQSCNAN